MTTEGQEEQLSPPKSFTRSPNPMHKVGRGPHDPVTSSFVKQGLAPAVLPKLGKSFSIQPSTPLLTAQSLYYQHVSH